METSVALLQPDDDRNRMMMLISQAIDKGVPIETLERLLDMSEKMKASNAAEQFAVAMASFQADCPIIKKTKGVPTKSGIVAYRYAPIESIVAQVKFLLQQHGFSYSILTTTNMNDKTVTATCIAKHVLGHSESSSFSVPLGDGTAVMSNSQVVAAALTFAKRYAFCNCFGILTGDTDNDGANVTPKEEKVTILQLQEIAELLAQQQYSQEVLLTNYGVKTTEELTEKAADSFLVSLRKYVERLQKENDIPF